MDLNSLITYIVVIVLTYATIDSNADGVIAESQRNMDNRIVNGEDAQIEQFPYQVYVEIGEICGGALISPSVVLTAAHCYFPGWIGLVRAGSANKAHGGQIRTVKQGMRHPDWVGEPKLLNDIAIIILDEPFDLSPSVQPIKLPADENDNPSVGDVGVIAGWGHLFSWDELPKMLRKVDLAVMDRDTCQRQQNKFLPYQITEQKLCGGYLNNDKAICQGDSGGGFVVNGVLHGIASHNSGLYNCGNSGVPSVFTRVSSFRSWIRQSVDI